jgi:hypothetical protein
MAACWIVRDGRLAFAANAASNPLSRSTHVCHRPAGIRSGRDAASFDKECAVHL